MEHMHDAEKNLVAELVRRGKLDQKNYLVKDGSLEYRVLPDDKKFNAKNYSFVIGVSKKFNPARIKDSSDKLNPGLVADLPTFCRTPVTICERGDFHGGQRMFVLLAFAGIQISPASLQNSRRLSVAAVF